MMNRRMMLCPLACLFLLGGLSGCCCSTNSRAGYPVAPRPGVAPACDRCAGNGPLPPRFAPGPGPGPVVAGPSPANGFAPAPGAFSPQPGTGIQQNAFLSPGSPQTPPASAGSPGVYLEQPQPAVPEANQPLPADSGVPRESVRPSPPQTPEPPATPQRRTDEKSSPAMPVDIPHFAMVKPDIANGQEPFSEGINWLSKHGYRAVLHLRSPGEDDQAARRSFERHGMRYLSLELSPQTLSRDILNEFNRLVADTGNRPLFVYDKDSTLAGALWYLHLRFVEKKTDDEARQEAAQLGFKSSDQGAQATMWLAVQNLLKDLKP